MLVEVAKPVKFKKGDYGVFPKGGLSRKNNNLFVVVKGNYKSAGNTMIDIRFTGMPEHCINKVYVAGLAKASAQEIQLGHRC